jgi:hypothetical protein
LTPLSAVPLSLLSGLNPCSSSAVFEDKKGASMSFLDCFWWYNYWGGLPSREDIVSSSDVFTFMADGY